MGLRITAIGQVCTAKCNPGFDYATPPSAQCTAIAWSDANNTATAWAPVSGTCQPWPVIPNSDIVYQTAGLQLSFALSGNCTKQAADALGNGLVDDVHQLLGNAVDSTTVTVTMGIFDSSTKRLVSVVSTPCECCLSHVCKQHMC